MNSLENRQPPGAKPRSSSPEPGARPTSPLQTLESCFEERGSLGFTSQEHLQSQLVLQSQAALHKTNTNEVLKEGSAEDCA